MRSLLSYGGDKAGSSSHLHSVSDPQASAATDAFPKFPHNPNNVFDNTLPRGLLYKIIDLYFDYIYPLTPLLHRPTFLLDVQSRREDRRGEEEWAAMVLSLVAMTVTQLPYPLVPMARDDAKSLVHRCYQHARGWQVEEYESFTPNRGGCGLASLTTGAMMML